MDYTSGHSSATEYPYVIDRRESTYSIKQEAFWCMEFLHGWCSCQKAEFLIDLVLQSKPLKVVEIGVWGGKSLVPIAHALKKNGAGVIYGIDPWDKVASLRGMKNEGSKVFWQLADHGEVYRDLVERIKEFDLSAQIELICATSEEAYKIDQIDLLHVDGNHSEENSLFDVQKWVPYVKKGGYIIFDDMTWFEGGKFTTQKAVEWLDEHCFKLAEFTDISVWGVWIKL